VQSVGIAAKRVIVTLLVVYLLAVSFIAPLVSAEQVEKVVEVTIPAIEQKAEYKPGLIIMPKISRPYFVEPGRSFTLIVSKPLGIQKIIIDNGYGESYECVYNKLSDTVFAVKIPDSAEQGLYDLIIYTSEGIYGEPNSIYVGDASSFEKLNIVHVTDRHFGVINPNGRKASNYDLAVNFVVLGLPDNTIIVDSGDLADTARDSEYMESLLVDSLLNKPVVGVPGNHDHVGGSTNYEAYRGPFNYTLDIFGLYRIVGIDSGSDGYITQSQASWARNILTSTEEPIKILIFHHPHFTHMFGGIPFQFNVSSSEDLFKLLTSKKPNSKYTYIYSSWLKNEEALKTLVDGMFNAKAEAVLVFSGHVHLDSYAVVTRPDGSKIHYIVTVTTAGSVRPGDYHGFRIVTVDPLGKVEFHGDGDYWTRHASFNVDKIHASYVETKNAVTATLRIDESKITEYMEKTVVALHVPDQWLGKNVKLYMKGLDSYKLRCTALGCILYAFANEKPVQGFEYQATLFTKLDEKPPVLELVKMTPSSPRQGRQLVLSFRVGDDSWGIKEAYAKIEYDGQKIVIKPMIVGNDMRIVVPPLKATEAKITVVVVDASGKETVFTKTIEYKTTTITTAVATTTTVAESETPTTTTAETYAETFTQQLGTATSEKPSGFSITLTVPKLQIEEATSATKPAAPVDNTGLIVAAVVVLSLAAFALIITRR